MLDSEPFLGVGEYTLLTVLAVVAVVVLELAWLRTGVFRTAQYWITMAIVFAFQVAVDGWLTKLDNPIVIYNERQMTGLRLPWDIPVEDFGFGFAMVTFAILLWRHRLDQGSSAPESTAARRSRQTVPRGRPRSTPFPEPTAPEQPAPKPEEARTRP
ncbi:lycopene cyclase domain-containing protein [uncultured Friedmanniella sp.]|uniref:lycopene cyclase domain-containing protein n=1 Tax=uncultured Friedmanniella sp. TaxID=335381 RepID=UPI0035CC22BD